MNAARVFFVGGLISFRALFGFLRPSIYIPGMLVAPLFQILLFVYIGRSAGLESDRFYVVGNALQYAAVPCLFAMIFTVAGERHQRTLGYLLVTPAPRLPLFLGRAVPVAVNGFFVAAFSLVVGNAIVGAGIPASAWPALALATPASGCSCASRPCSRTCSSGCC
jgi:ABC-2 type transport system permease protein